MRTRVIGAVALTLTLVGCSGGGSSSSIDGGPAPSSGTQTQGQDPSAGPSASSAPSSPEELLESLAQDAPPRPVPDAASQYAAALAQTNIDFTQCHESTAGKSGCAKPATLGKRELQQNVNVEIVLDASGSMKEKVGAQTKIDIARRSIAEFVGQLPKSAKVSLRTFGNGADEPKAVSCASSRLVLPFQAPDAGRFTDALGRTRVQGYTPLAGALKKAKTDFSSRPAKTNSNFVYVVSDGEETCDGDPVAAAKELASADVGVQVNVIGFAVDSKAAAQLRAAATAGGGVYADAADDKALDKAFTQTGDWKAWTAYYNCRYAEAQRALTRADMASIDELNCLQLLIAKEYSTLNDNATALSDELRAQGEAREAYLRRKIAELPEDQQAGLASLATHQTVEANAAIDDAFGEVLVMTNARLDKLNEAAAARRASDFADAQAEHDAAIDELDTTRDAMGLEPGH